ncbi:MAG: 3'-5' exonuclease [Bacteroidales bacterium]|jgi:DNA polymerase-3 subunit epsilon|nr:3'-5' exonuclease [Bacteroidales bacterium]
MTDFAAIDLETANHHLSSVCSVGLIVVRGGTIVDKYYSLIQPEPNYYAPLNTRVHGLSCKHTDKALVFSEVWKQIAPRIEGLPLVAHNKVFEENCLKAVFRTYCLDYPDYKFYCTLKAGRKHFPFLSNHKLPTVAAQCGYYFTNHHHALVDAEACAIIALAIL